MIIFAWRLQTSRKLSNKKSKNNWKTQNLDWLFDRY